MNDTKLNFWLPQELADALRAEAKRQMVSMSTIIRWAIVAELKRLGGQEESPA